MAVPSTMEQAVEALTAASLASECVIIPYDSIAATDAAAFLVSILGSRIKLLDGVSDEVEVNAAIAALPAQGGRITILAGTVLISAAITTVHDTQLVGMGKDATVIKQADHANIATGLIYMESNFNRGLLQDLGIDGNHANNSSGYGIYARGIWYADFVRIKIKECTTYGIRVTSTAGGVYSGECYFEDIYCHENPGIGFSISACGDCVFVDCYTYDNGGVGWHIVASHNVFFHCHAYGDDTYGFQIDNTADHTAMFGCTGDKVGRHGFYINCGESQFIGCYAYDCNQASGGAGDYDGFRVTGTYNTLQGCLCKDDQGAGSRTQVYGIRESGSADHNVYIGNILREAKTGPMVIIGEASIVRDNEGYIHHGEIRTKYKALTAGVANAIGLAWQNPEAQAVYVRKINVPVTTGGGTPGSHFDMGVADDATGTNRGTEFFNDLHLETAQLNDSWLAGDGGQQTKAVKLEANGNATDAWVVGQILDANASALVGSALFEYMGA